MKKSAKPKEDIAETSASEVLPETPRQVVEVVEEGPQPESISEPEASADPVLANDSDAFAAEDQVSGPQIEQPQDPPSGRQELVEELFDRKNVSLPEISVHKGNPVLPIILWVIIVVVAALVTGGVLFFAMNRPVVKMPVLFAKPTPTPTLAPTPTPAPAVSRADITIQVLNGGGTPGAAGKMKKFLEDKGYTVKDVGNTDEYTYTKTIIMVHANKQHIAALLEEDLKGAYSLDTSSMELPQDTSYEARVIVGKE